VGKKPPILSGDQKPVQNRMYYSGFTNTSLAVLSVCDTGMGDMKTGKGVFGLRSAFALAGAKTLAMSLWKVPDTPTQELIEDFYCRLLRGTPKADALREAQLELRKKYPHRRDGGAFICQADPGPLLAGK
jgi:CHAT domain-containing protein